MGATGETDSGRKSIEDNENEAEAFLLLLNEQKKTQNTRCTLRSKGGKNNILVSNASATTDRVANEVTRSTGSGNHRHGTNFLTGISSSHLGWSNGMHWDLCSVCRVSVCRSVDGLICIIHRNVGKACLSNKQNSTQNEQRNDRAGNELFHILILLFKYKANNASINTFVQILDCKTSLS